MPKGIGRRMDLALNKEQVVALAPDAASAKAAAGLVSDGKWELLGADADALWGECKGSGAKPYQTQVDKAAMVTRCSCPSRKFPCKHGLALLLMYVQPNPRFAKSAPRPEWVAQWLASRQERQAKKEQSTERPPQDPASAAAASLKRKEQRWSRIESGGADLQRWIADQFRGGLARFGQEQRGEWRSMAARMVDAQAPGLGQLLQLALAAIERGSEGYEEAAERLGTLQLLCEGISRRHRLAAPRFADLRVALGWPIDKDEMAADTMGDILSDHWCTLGVANFEHDERLRERRVWLRGTQSGRHALLLDFAFKGAGWETQWIAGAAYPATLRFHPGSVLLRATVVEQGNASSHEWPTIDADTAIDRASQWLGDNPWLPRVPLLLDSVQADIDADGWLLRSSQGRFPLLLDAATGWSLLAFSGGHAMRLMGEWDGRHLQPLQACLQDEPGQRWTPAIIGDAA